LVKLVYFTSKVLSHLKLVRLGKSNPDTVGVVYL
jgi:hypothetical protein